MKTTPTMASRDLAALTARIEALEATVHNYITPPSGDPLRRLTLAAQAKGEQAVAELGQLLDGIALEEPVYHSTSGRDPIGVLRISPSDGWGSVRTLAIVEICRLWSELGGATAAFGGEEVWFSSADGRFDEASIAQAVGLAIVAELRAPKAPQHAPVRPWAR